jgi:hypothetical protein
VVAAEDGDDVDGYLVVAAVSKIEAEARRLQPTGAAFLPGLSAEFV